MPELARLAWGALGHWSTVRFRLVSGCCDYAENEVILDTWGCVAESLE